MTITSNVHTTSTELDASVRPQGEGTATPFRRRIELALAPDARIVMTGEERTDREDLSKDGADHVLIPGEITGERIFELLTDGRL